MTSDTNGQDSEPSWKRTLQLMGIAALTVGHITALVVGGYDEWPLWAAVLNFVGLALFLIPAIVVRLSR